MKRLSIKIKDLVKRGYLRIFPLPSFVLYILVFIVAYTLIGCAIPRQVSQLVESKFIDTLYLSNVQYYSIYIYKDKLTDRSRDTIYIKDVSVEYRYKLLRNTVYKMQVDSLSYQVTVTEIKEITRPLTLYDKTCRACFWFLLGILGFYLIRLF